MKLVVEDRSRWVLPELLRERARDLADKPFLSFAKNDASATYGESCDVWECDHFGLVNWHHPINPWCDRVPDYARLLGRLADKGF